LLPDKEHLRDASEAVLKEAASSLHWLQLYILAQSIDKQE
jgi:hypothetical protein